MSFEGKWKVTNGLVFMVHPNIAAMKGEVEIRYRGHSLNYDKLGRGIIFELVAVWNANGECVSVQGVADNVSNYDLQECLNNKTTGESYGGTVGCRQCSRG
jgi:hypothetical protein